MRTLLIVLALGFFAASCEKIVAEDITTETPVLILPTSNDTVEVNPVHFKWEAMEGASKYHLEVVSPSFGSISEFSLDSIVTGTDFYFSLDSNEYELKLTALNGGYESQVLGPIKFWVGVAPSVGSGGSSLVLTSPLNQVYENGSFTNQFTWTAVSGATSYEFSLREGNSFATGSILEAQNGISTLTYQVANGLLIEGNYFWGVKAYIGTTELPYTVHELYIDETLPNLAVLSSPGDLSVQTSGTVNFTWVNGTDPGTVNAPVVSFVEVASDINFSTNLDTVSVIGNSTTFDLTPGSYYWRVTNTDEAGNTAGTTLENQFTLN